MAIKSLEKLIAANPEIFSDYSDERGGPDSNGVWLYCKADYYCPMMECGTIHESTVREVLALAKTVRKYTDKELFEIADMNAQIQAGTFYK